jgi:transposase-like protein
VGWMRAIEAGSTRQKRWAELIWQQKQSRVSVSAFCREHSVREQSFYYWRKRLGNESEPVRFALVEAGMQAALDRAPIELALASGDRLYIAAGADAATLRTVLSVLRDRP